MKTGFGVRWIGGVLPFIGFRQSTMSRSMAVDFGIFASEPEVRVETLEVEWFNRGMVLMIKHLPTIRDAGAGEK